VPRSQDFEEHGRRVPPQGPASFPPLLAPDRGFGCERPNLGRRSRGGGDRRASLSELRRVATRAPFGLLRPQGVAEAAGEEAFAPDREAGETEVAVPPDRYDRVARRARHLRAVGLSHAAGPGRLLPAFGPRGSRSAPGTPPENRRPGPLTSPSA